MKIRHNEQELYEVRDNGKLTIKSLNEFEGLVLVDDKVYDVKLLKDEVTLHPSTIRSIEILKGDKATELYGIKGEKGVMRITTKKPR